MEMSPMTLTPLLQGAPNDCNNLVSMNTCYTMMRHHIGVGFIHNKARHKLSTNSISISCSNVRAFEAIFCSVL